MDMVLKEQL